MKTGAWNVVDDFVDNLLRKRIHDELVVAGDWAEVGGWKKPTWRRAEDFVDHRERPTLTYIQGYLTPAGLSFPLTAVSHLSRQTV